MGCCNNSLTESVMKAEKNNTIDRTTKKKTSNNNSNNVSFMMEENTQIYDNNNVKVWDQREILKNKSKDHYISNNEQLPDGLKGPCDVTKQSDRLATKHQMEKEEWNGDDYKKDKLDSRKMYNSVEKYVEGNNLKTEDGGTGNYKKDEKEKKLDIYDEQKKSEKKGNTVTTEKVKTIKKEDVKNIKEEYSITKKNDNNFNFNDFNDKFKEYKEDMNNNTRKVALKKFGNGDDFEKEHEKAGQKFEKKRMEFGNNFYNNSKEVVYQNKKSSYKVQEEQQNIVKTKKEIN